MISSQEFKIICRMIKGLETSSETRLDNRLDGFGRKFIGMLQGFSILDPDKQTMTSREVCEQYGVSDRKLCDMRKNGEIPFTKHGTAKNSKITYRVADVAEVFASRDS